MSEITSNTGRQSAGKEFSGTFFLLLKEAM